MTASRLQSVLGPLVLLVALASGTSGWDAPGCGDSQSCAASLIQRTHNLKQVMASSTEPEEGTYKYKVDMRSGTPFKEKEIRDIYDHNFGVAENGEESDTLSKELCVEADGTVPEGLVLPRICGLEKFKKAYSDEETRGERDDHPVGNKITVDGDVVTYSTCVRTVGSESKSYTCDEKHTLKSESGVLRILKMEWSNFIEGECAASLIQRTHNLKQVMASSTEPEAGTYNYEVDMLGETFEEKEIRDIYDQLFGVTIPAKNEGFDTLTKDLCVKAYGPIPQGVVLPEVCGLDEFKKAYSEQLFSERDDHPIGDKMVVLGDYVIYSACLHTTGDGPSYTVTQRDLLSRSESGVVRIKKMEWMNFQKSETSECA